MNEAPDTSTPSPVTAPPVSSTPPAAPSGTTPIPVTVGTDPAPTAPAVNTDPPATPNAEFRVPEQYKDKGWASKVKSIDDLYKQVDELDALKGRKMVTPDLKTATPEDREAFYAQLRPKDASEYEFTGDMASPEIKTAVAKLFMDNGISAVQGNEIIKQYQAIGEAETAKMYDADGFKTTMKQAFGDDWEKITGRAYNNLQSMMSPQDQEAMKLLPNAQAALVYRVLANTDQAVQGMKKAYGVTETDLAHFSGRSSGAGSNDVDLQRSSLRAEMSRLVLGPHTEQQKMDLRNKLAATYKNDPRMV